jgi:dolichol kinase
MKPSPRKTSVISVIPAWIPRPGSLALRGDLHLARKLWHLSMGLLIVTIYSSGVQRWPGVVILSSFLGLSLLLEIARLKNPEINSKIMRFWGPIMRQSEATSLSGVPFYLASSALAVAIFPQPIAVLAILFLAVGDPMASVFGILYGNKSIRFRNGKSLIGTLAGVVSCALISHIYLNHLRSTGADLSVNQIWLMTWIGGLAGGAAEMVPLETDDNFAIPVISGMVLWFSFIFLGIG